MKALTFLSVKIGGKTIKSGDTMFLNLRDGNLTINTYRFPDAFSTCQADLLKIFQRGKIETLTAIVDTKEIPDRVVKSGLRNDDLLNWLAIHG